MLSPRCLNCLFLAATCPCAGQIDYLTATDDGEQIYFSTPLRMRGTEQYFHTKILRISEGRLELFAQQAVGPGAPNDDPRLSNFHLFYQPVVSGDGAVVGYSMMRTCTPVSSGCALLDRFAGTIVRSAKPELVLPGPVFVNKNGRYAVVTVQIGGSGLRRYDLETGEQINPPISAQPLFNDQTLTDDGKVLFYDIESGLTLWSPTESVPIRISLPEPARQYRYPT